jgi:alpha-galactosidase
MGSFSPRSTPSAAAGFFPQKFGQLVKSGLRGMLLALLLLAGLTQALDNGLALTPPMGWRSWNCFHGDVNDTIIKATVDALVQKHDGKSLLDAGYNHVGVDDGWQSCGAGPGGSFHDKDGKPIVNETTFPDLKAWLTTGTARAR